MDDLAWAVVDALDALAAGDDPGDPFDAITDEALKLAAVSRGIPVAFDADRDELVHALLTDRLDDGEVERGRPYPGQRYRHGWIPVGGSLDNARRWHGDNVAHLAELGRAVDSGAKKRHRLNGGQMGVVHLVDHNNGTTTIDKTMGDITNTMGPGFELERQADAEQLAAALGHRIGAPVPKVMRTSPAKVTMELVHGDRWTDLEADASNPLEAAMLTVTRDRLVRSRDGTRLGVFDLLTANWDRDNGTNWLVEDDTNRPVGIDHALAWSEDGENPAIPPYGYQIGPFAAPFVTPMTTGMRRWVTSGQHHRPQWVDNPLTPADIDWLRQRLAEARSDFDRLDRHDWWQFATARLEAIAAHARGTEPIFT